ncbi:PEP-CTERM sorting domain-containing protein [Myxococcota bacterium]|nr:PEP-CTERM sorting domain-containing protein [Myxococcota bacterium]
MRFIATAVLATCSALLLSSTSFAASYTGPFNGTTVTFLNVADQNGLFGAPTVSGDSLDFSPSAFEADCGPDPLCPPSPTVVDDTLTLTIQANSGSFLDDIHLSEAGDTTLVSFLNAFGATQVTATVFVDIFEINNVSVNNINANAQMTFSRNGQYETTDEGPGTHIWTGSLLIDLDAIIASNGGTGRATRVQLNLNNTLIAFAASGASARIEKKDIDGLAITVIPEPGTAVLMGLGLLGLASTRRSAR